MTDIIKVVRQFTKAVGCTTDHYNVRQTALYIGLQLEEMAEKLEACLGADSLLTISLNEASARFKAGDFDHRVEAADRAAMLDADIDLAWVTIGSALSQGADVEGAAGEVARANLGKLVGCNECHSTDKELVAGRTVCDAFLCKGTGLVAIKDDNGKVKKPDGWTAPNIEPFVCKEAANG